MLIYLCVSFVVAGGLFVWYGWLYTSNIATQSAIIDQCWLSHRWWYRWMASWIMGPRLQPSESIQQHPSATLVCFKVLSHWIFAFDFSSLKVCQWMRVISWFLHTHTRNAIIGIDNSAGDENVYVDYLQISKPSAKMITWRFASVSMDHLTAFYIQLVSIMK